MERNDIIKEIEDVTTLLYQQKTPEGYEKLNVLIQHLAVYVNLITDEEKQMELLEVLKETLSAMEEKDTTLLADLLKYELTEKL